MGKAILAAIITFIIAIFSEVLLRTQLNMPGIGTIFAVSVMGGFIIYFNQKKK